MWLDWQECCCSLILGCSLALRARRHEVSLSHRHQWEAGTASNTRSGGHTWCAAGHTAGMLHPCTICVVGDTLTLHIYTSTFSHRIFRPTLPPKKDILHGDASS